MLKKSLVATLSLFILAPQAVFAVDYMATTPAKLSPASARVQNAMTKKTFKEQIQTIKDTTKKTVAERINTKISTANSNLTSKMQSSLTRMSAVVERIASKGATLATSGVDTTTLETAILNAQNAIQTSQLAVSTQAANTYTAEITDESLLRNAIGAMVSEFRQDISATHLTVVDAKKAVIGAMQELLKISPEGTSAKEFVPIR